MPENPTKSSQTGTLGKVMQVLDTIAAAKESVRFTDLLQQLDLPRATLHRQLSHLAEEGLVLQRHDGSYELGMRLLQLASRAWAGNSLRRAAEPLLQGLHQRTQETVHLAVLQDTRVVYLDKVEGQQTVRMHSQVGNASPVYCTGVGKAMLSALPDEHLKQLLNSLEFQAYTEHTLTSQQALWQEIQQVRQLGYAEDREEHEPGIRCVAAPVLSNRGDLICGISVTAPLYRLKEAQLQQWQQWVPEAAQSLGQHLQVELGPRARH